MHMYTILTTQPIHTQAIECLKSVKLVEMIDVKAITDVSWNIYVLPYASSHTIMHTGE